jgi:hypothetical protein
MYQIIVIQVISKHKTKRAASAALRKLTDKHGEMAMVVEVPEEIDSKKEKRR